MKKPFIILCMVFLAQFLLFSEAFAQFTKTKRNIFWFVLPDCSQGRLGIFYAEKCKRFLIVENVKGSLTLSIKFRELEFPHRPAGSMLPAIQTEKAMTYDIDIDLHYCARPGVDPLTFCEARKILEVTTIHSFNEGESDIRVALEVTDIDENWHFSIPPIIRLR